MVELIVLASVVVIVLAYAAAALVRWEVRRTLASARGVEKPTTIQRAARQLGVTDVCPFTACPHCVAGEYERCRAEQTLCCVDIERAWRVGAQLLETD